MEVFEFSKQLNIPKNSALCLGNFDGVHLGHRRLFDFAGAKNGWGAMVFTANFRGDKQLTTLKEKLDILEKLGADFAVAVNPDSEFLSLTGEEFYQILKNSGAEKLVAGYDFRFGKGAECTAWDLADWCKRDGLLVHIEGEYDLLGEAVKSTRIREAVKIGNLPLANELLGYSYFLLGCVEEGLQNGTKMGFPTANVSYGKDKLLPSDGVYMGTIEIDSKSHRALINIGKNPTFDAQSRTVEVHIPNFYADIYGKSVRVEFLEKIRDEIKFDSVDQLIEQIKTDVDYVMAKGEKSTGLARNICLGIFCSLFYYFSHHLTCALYYNQWYSDMQHEIILLLSAVPGIALAFLLIRNSLKSFFKAWGTCFLSSVCLMLLWNYLPIDRMIHYKLTGYEEYGAGVGVVTLYQLLSYIRLCSIGCTFAGIVSAIKQSWYRRKIRNR